MNFRRRLTLKKTNDFERATIELANSASEIFGDQIENVWNHVIIPVSLHVAATLLQAVNEKDLSEDEFNELASECVDTGMMFFDIDEDVEETIASLIVEYANLILEYIQETDEAPVIPQIRIKVTDGDIPDSIFNSWSERKKRFK